MDFNSIFLTDEELETLDLYQSVNVYHCDTSKPDPVQRKLLSLGFISSHYLSDDGQGGYTSDGYQVTYDGFRYLIFIANQKRRKKKEITRWIIDVLVALVSAALGAFLGSRSF